MAGKHSIIIGDSRDMGELDDASVHLVITSPPYWQLKDYGGEAQVGFHNTYEEYINNLNLVWSECHRVLHTGCRLCVNIGDQFARAAYYGRYKVIPIRTEITKFCETVGFDYMGAIIWQKVTTCNTTGGATIMGSFPYPRNGILKINYEFILIFKKPGEALPPTSEQKKNSKLTTEEWNEYFSGHWTFPGAKQKGHIAMFPEELPRRLIRMFSFPEETVLDPFLGSGTTSLAAANLDRDSIGYEINKEYVPIIREKLGLQKGSLFEAPGFDLTIRDENGHGYEDQIKKLPYIFKDPHLVLRIGDPKKKTYGSNIDGTRTYSEDYFTVKKIISPELIELKDGRTVRLLGVKSKGNKSEAAMEFLTSQAGGQRIFMKFDTPGSDEDGHPFCYMYLKNRKFLNAHLVKNGLADVDTSMEYKHKNKFLKHRDDLL